MQLAPGVGVIPRRGSHGVGALLGREVKDVVLLDAGLPPLPRFPAVGAGPEAALAVAKEGPERRGLLRLRVLAGECSKRPMSTLHWIGE